MRVASAIVDMIHNEVATKANVAAVKADIAAVHGDLASVEHRLLTRLRGLVVVAFGVLFAALHCWPPH
jgi:hypothetical protein